jgi:hypothetical protein
MGRKPVPLVCCNDSSRMQGSANERAMHTILAPRMTETRERGPSYPPVFVEATLASCLPACFRTISLRLCLCLASVVVLFLLFAPKGYMYLTRANLWPPPNFQVHKLNGMSSHHNSPGDYTRRHSFQPPPVSPPRSVEIPVSDVVPDMSV